MNTREKLLELLDYVEELARLPEKVVFSVRKYRNLHYFEHQLRGKVGISHDLSDDESAVWLKIERLHRTRPPKPDEEISDWLTISNDPNTRPQIADSIIASVVNEKVKELIRTELIDEEDLLETQENLSEIVDVRLRLDRLPDLETRIQNYIDGIWTEWSAAEIPKCETIAIYERFFGVVQHIETASVEQPLEVVLGVGIALWNAESRTVEHPIVELPVEASVDSDTQAIQIRPREAQPQVYLKPFTELGIATVPSVKTAAMEFFEQYASADGDDIGEESGGISPFAAESFERVLHDAVAKLSADGVYWPDVAEDPDDRSLPAATDDLTVTDSWAIYARPRSSNVFVQDIDRIRDAIDEREEEDVPVIGGDIVTDPTDRIDDEPGVEPGPQQGRSRESGGSTSLEDVEGLGVLFPKPFNDAQIDIIHRLNREDGVVVQGPPGTGKTHTIANIICHYLATGRSVLVVSKGEPALEVLQSQIPEEIRKLTISLLTSEREGLKQLEAAVSFMADDVVQKDMGQLQRQRAEFEKEIAILRNDSARIEQEIISWARKQLQNVPESLCDDNKRFPADVAQVVSECRDRHKWLPDRIGCGEEFTPQFSQEDLDDLISARRRLGIDLVYVDARFPAGNDLPDAQTIIAAHEELCTAAAITLKAKNRQLPSVRLHSNESVRRAERLRDDLIALRDAFLTAKEEPWLFSLFKNWLRDGNAADDTRFFCELLKDLDELASRREAFMQKPVALPEGAHDDELTRTAVGRAAKGERPFPLLAMRAQEAKRLFSEIEVSGSAPRTSEDWGFVSAYLTFQDDLVAIVARWNAMATDFDLPEVSREPGHAAKWIVDTRKLLTQVVSAALTYRQHSTDDIAELLDHEINRVELPLDQEELNRVIETLDSNLSRFRLNLARTTVESILEKARPCSGPVSEEIRSFLNDCVGSDSHNTEEVAERWRTLIEELRRLSLLRNEIGTVARVSQLISQSGAKEWASQARECAITTGDDHIVPPHALESWRFRRIEAYLQGINGRVALSKLVKQQEKCNRKIERATSKVIQLRTFVGLHTRMKRGGRLNALMRFLHAIRQIGAGTGIRARRYRGNAQRAMVECMDSVPCWIMPTWRVSESLPAKLEAFDLVIVDEASQSDIMALPVLLRGKKLLVVGDDRQVSPSPIGLEERKLLQLRHNYLRNQPFGDMLMPGTSLYDLALAVYPTARTVLNEHFRCVEPIIRFSLQFYSGQKITPLRIPTPTERLDPPLIDVFVANGVRDSKKTNRNEAIAVVDEIEQLVNDPTFADRSIGVISLIGGKQANLIQNLLLERIGETAFLRHRIACGDSATFQGKERDVIFLSMVASPGKASALTARIYEQRFNVAMSRARDRMYLFRSVQTEDLGNPKDLKLRVIQHFQNPMPAGHEQLKNLSDLCESDFELTFFHELVEMGYRVTPQVPAGEYRIDLVIDGDNDRRLAVELDGDRYHGPDQWFDDYRRQKVLERVGWRFWRCWSSSYSLDPEGCRAELVSELESLGIEPIGQECGSRKYTEHRTINADEDSLPFADDPIESEAFAETGDKLIVVFDDEPNRHWVLTLADKSEDLLNGIVAAESAIGRLLAGSRADDELELEWKGTPRKAVVLEIQKTTSQPSDATELAPFVSGVEAKDERELDESKANPATEKTDIPPATAAANNGHPDASTQQSGETDVTAAVTSESDRTDEAGEVDSPPEQRVLFPEPKEVGAATEEERARYEEYSRSLKSEGLTPRKLPDWLDAFRAAQRGRN